MRTTMPQQQQQQQQPRRPADPHRLFEDEEEELSAAQRGPRAPPPVDAAKPSTVQSSTQPSVSVEQAAKPTFQIYVGDPVKIGDLTSSHIVYSVRTRVRTDRTIQPSNGESRKLIKRGFYSTDHVESLQAA